MLNEPEVERRKGDTLKFLGLEFDKKINLPGAVALLVLLYSLYTGFVSIKSDFTTLHKQHDLMWKHFIKHETDINQEEIQELLR